MTLAVVGRGRVGTALGAALGVDVLDSRVRVPAFETYVLAVRDPVIADVARAILADQPRARLLHTAGGLPSQVLVDAGAREAAVMHPLVAFAGAAPSLSGALFAVEGSAAAYAEGLVGRLGGTALRLDAGQLARYHAAAVLASNHVLGLVAVAQGMLTGLGADAALAQRALVQLFGGVAANLSARGLPDALTGPIARGDVAAVERNLAALDEGERRYYAMTALPLLAIASAQGGAARSELDRIRALLLLYAPASVG